MTNINEVQIREKIKQIYKEKFEKAYDGKVDYLRLNFSDNTSLIGDSRKRPFRLRQIQIQEKEKG